MKAVAKTNSKGFQYLNKKFPNITTGRLKEVIFMGPHIREILDNEAFVVCLTDTELAAWESFKWVCANFLGRKESPNFSDGIQKRLNTYNEMRCRMYFKFTFCIHV